MEPTSKYEAAKQLKKRLDDEKIARSAFVHIYSATEWVQWTGNNYIKSHYDVMTPDGKILFHFWPNGGQLSNGKHQYSENADIKIRLSETSRI